MWTTPSCGPRSLTKLREKREEMSNVTASLSLSASCLRTQYDKLPHVCHTNYGHYYSFCAFPHHDGPHFELWAKMNPSFPELLFQSQQQEQQLLVSTWFCLVFRLDLQWVRYDKTWENSSYVLVAVSPSDQNSPFVFKHSWRCSLDIPQKPKCRGIFLIATYTS